ncbi:hypothetical protein [Actinocorallia populi]|uniref:hypothetical protein n=1 Tax=Actinocorallia populi TaxID=2079200 RepID=UPI000D08D716|nr:hypothetical protein [Actinocorallia populi]
MKFRKPALAAATLALAITPALTAVTPAQAAPSRATIVGAALAEELSLVEQILSAFPTGMADAARLVLAGDLSQVFVLFGEATKLTPTQINTIFAKLQEILGQFGGGVVPTPAPTEPAPVPPADPAPTQPAPDPAPVVTPASATGGPVFVQVGAPGDAGEQKAAWILDALLKDAGKKRSAPLLANILVNVVLAAQ